MLMVLPVSCSGECVKAKEVSAVVGAGYVVEAEICLGMLFGFFLFFRGPFICSFAFLDLALWVPELMTDVGAVGVVPVAVSTDRKLTVDLLPMVLGSTGEEVVRGCSFPAERLVTPCASVASW